MLELMGLGVNWFAQRGEGSLISRSRDGRGRQSKSASLSVSVRLSEDVGFHIQVLNLSFNF